MLYIFIPVVGLIVLAIIDISRALWFSRCINNQLSAANQEPCIGVSIGRDIICTGSHRKFVKGYVTSRLDLPLFNSRVTKSELWVVKDIIKAALQSNRNTLSIDKAISNKCVERCSLNDHLVNDTRYLPYLRVMCNTNNLNAEDYLAKGIVEDLSYCDNLY